MSLSGGGIKIVKSKFSKATNLVYFLRRAGFIQRIQHVQPRSWGDSRLVVIGGEEVTKRERNRWAALSP